MSGTPKNKRNLFGVLKKKIRGVKAAESFKKNPRPLGEALQDAIDNGDNSDDSYSNDEDEDGDYNVYGEEGAPNVSNEYLQNLCE